MKIMTLPRYAQHSAYRDSVNGSPAVRAMKRCDTVAVDANAFVYAVQLFGDAFYPDENGQAAGRDAIVSAWFAKGNARFCIETKASELARVIGRENIPDEWLVRAH